MYVTALGKFGFSSVTPTCWDVLLERPTEIMFALRPFSPTFVNLTAVRFKTYHSIWAPVQGSAHSPAFTGLGYTCLTAANARYWKRDVEPYSF